MSAVLAEPIVRILFQRGHFTAAQTPVVAGCLAAFSAGLVFNGAMLMLNRAFFSLQSNWIPTVVALGNLFLNAVLDFAFYRFGVWGIPLSTARRATSPARGRCSCCCAAGSAGSTAARIASTTVRVVGRVGGRRRRSPAAVWQPLDSALGRSFRGAGRLARHGARGGDRRSTSSAASCCRCASWRRCSRCARASAGPDAAEPSRRAGWIRAERELTGA